jgi:hypothetical protein
VNTIVIAGLLLVVVLLLVELRRALRGWAGSRKTVKLLDQEWGKSISNLKLATAALEKASADLGVLEDQVRKVTLERDWAIAWGHEWERAIVARYPMGWAYDPTVPGRMVHNVLAEQDRLVSSLSSENERLRAAMEKLRMVEGSAYGDVVSLQIINTALAETAKTVGES